MEDKKRFWVAAFNIFLILSAGPVGAARVSVENDAQSGLVDLPAEIDSQQCGELQQIFITKTNELDSRVTTLQGEGLGARGQLGVAMKMRSMVSTLRRATNLECEWALGTDQNTEVLESIAERASNDSPCLESVREQLAAVQDAPEEEQIEVLLGAMQSLVSDECETSAEEQAEDEQEDMPAMDSPEMISQVEMQTLQMENEADNMIEEFVEQELTSDASLMQTALADNLGQRLMRVVTLVATIIVVGLTCVLTFTIMLAIIALILCIVIGFIGLLFWRPHWGGGCFRWFGRIARRIPRGCFLTALLDQLGVPRYIASPRGQTTHTYDLRTGETHTTHRRNYYRRDHVLGTHGDGLRIR